MKELVSTSRFRRDFKRYKRNTRKVEKLFEVLNMLKNDVELPPNVFPHKLTGNYKGHMECHIGSDYLLIWIDETEQIIKLVRLGTHAELFGK